jgi:predicted AAA+ superfamily ATPase
MNITEEETNLSKSMKARDKQLILTEDPLPKQSTNHLIIAPRGSGKSTFLYNILSSHEGYKNAFDNLYLFSPTARNDLKLIDLVEELQEDGRYFDEINDNNLNQMLDEIKYINENWDYKKKKREPLHCCIIDDNMPFVLKRKNPVLQHIFITNRHYKMSLICSVHRFKIPPILLAQVDLITIWKMKNKKEVKGLCETFDLNEDLLNYCWNEPFSFMHISYCNGRPTYFKNLIN